MDEFAVEMIARAADGTVSPFHVFVGEPEPGSDGQCADCLVWCTLLNKPTHVRGESLRQAYSLGFDLVRRLVEYSDLTLEHPTGCPFTLPSPPHEFQE